MVIQSRPKLKPKRVKEGETLSGCETGNGCSPRILSLWSIMLNQLQGILKREVKPQEEKNKF